jgi:hypothetical protein
MSKLIHCIRVQKVTVYDQPFSNFGAQLHRDSIIIHGGLPSMGPGPELQPITKGNGITKTCNRKISFFHGNGELFSFQ